MGHHGVKTDVTKAGNLVEFQSFGNQSENLSFSVDPPPVDVPVVGLGFWYFRHWQA
jgi:hypothetical protein